MRLYSGQTRPISREMIDELLKEEAIEVEDGHDEEARVDLESVLKEYIRVDRDLSDQAREMARQRGMGSNAFGRIKRQLARDADFQVGDDAINWIIDQTIEMLLYSHNVEEVYASDRELRVILRKVLRRHSEVETELDKEVRGKLRNLEEGSASWDVEYKKAMENLKRHKGLV